MKRGADKLRWGGGGGWQHPVFSVIQAIKMGAHKPSSENIKDYLL
jgi:hypothetical protein